MAKRCEWAGDERRRKAEHGGVGPHSRGASEMAIGSGAGEVGSFSWRSRARRLAVSVAQLERPRNRSRAAARDRTTKPSWGLMPSMMPRRG